MERHCGPMAEEQPQAFRRHLRKAFAEQVAGKGTNERGSCGHRTTTASEPNASAQPSTKDDQGEERQGGQRVRQSVAGPTISARLMIIGLETPVCRGRRSSGLLASFEIVAADNQEGASIRPSCSARRRRTHGLHHPRQPQPTRRHPAEGLSRQSGFLRDLSNQLAVGTCRAVVSCSPSSSPGSAAITSLLGVLDTL
jgi:hypothetical protein